MRRLSPRFHPQISQREFPADCSACQASIEGLCVSCTIQAQRIIVAYKSRDRFIKAGDDLFRAGEPCDAIYYLLDGWIFLYTIIEDGRRQILHFALPGAFISLYPGRVAGYGGQALTDAAICVVPHENLMRLAEQFPAVALHTTSIIWQERNLAYDHLSNIGRRSARERVARTLLELFVRRRMQWPTYRSEEIQLPVTQEHIGDAIELTGIHVNRILRDLRGEGILDFHYRRLRILDPDKLMDAASVDVPTTLSWLSHT